MRCPRHPDRDQSVEKAPAWRREGVCDLCSVLLCDPAGPDFWERAEKFQKADADRAEYAKHFRPAWGSPVTGREALAGLDFHRAYELLR